ncbi:hypothetical protein NTHI1209_00668 [Haemophilus influenzae]|uniref:Uncharacterized protein n=1 Tax=Haemophilus influenzae TaxID=727 RepID=A0A158SW21_HAEIF|nr:hypothetical protein NTHI1209_00668 [Haemophilus influenzae]
MTGDKIVCYFTKKRLKFKPSAFLNPNEFTFYSTCWSNLQSLNRCAYSSRYLSIVNKNYSQFQKYS